jgi:hypothetical protein
MLRIEGHTKLAPTEVVERAAQFFGSYGLTIRGRTDHEVLLEGAGGGVDVFVTDQEKGADVEVVSREWDTQAREFLHSVMG